MDNARPLRPAGRESYTTDSGIEELHTHPVTASREGLRDVSEAGCTDCSTDRSSPLLDDRSGPYRGSDSCSGDVSPLRRRALPPPSLASAPKRRKVRASLPLVMLTKNHAAPFISCYRYFLLIVKVKRRLNYYQSKKFNLFDIFSEVASKHPKKTAIIFAEDERRWTFAELEKYASRVACYFSSIGVTKGNVVAVFVENCPEHVGMLLISFANFSFNGPYKT